MRLSLRILAVFEGIVGALVGFAISIVASILRVIGGAVGVSTDQAHFFLAIALSLLAFVGALLAIGPGVAAAVCLLVAAIGFFFVAGWWAIIPALFLLPAAWLAFVSSRAPAPAPVAAPQPQPAISEPLRQPSMAEASWRGEAPTVTQTVRPAIPEPQRYTEAPAVETPAHSAVSNPVERPVVSETVKPPVPTAPIEEPVPLAPIEEPVASAPAEESSVSEASPARSEPRREAQRLREPPPDTSLPGAPA